ncbi:Acyl-[acyl-carrier-protein]--UDP-N-acetylglucosamine O-acyltransferase [Saliniradius amylolyticus]|uniref:Acyl-[acyl-carrier-protein]--UDP-N-acetylglucosamine O-acyltransferase n=1 Tax=Saliniradius amylolyticus TaxID=2183582 RepID=A0A2S2E5T7_9ALTE|nr:acyl-ACP--UDP-N-acetylglucosamine O-acyltransferase [Saliniradius amylolyticus]AWL12600.1 Acyl-[acyl-carrier-protein]--UDP-N-acetylglucosamine O-acyltransferase [Saliniradius amylolyticus]
MIHQTAIIDPKASIGQNVSIGPYSVIGPDVVIGDNTVIESHVVVKGPTVMGRGNHIYQFASVGEDCQDKKYAGEPTRLEIGDNNVIRECVTVHRGTIQDNSLTKIGSDNLLMAYAHIAHDVVMGDNNIIANNGSIAGHVHIGDWVIIGGMSGVHQFCHIGSHSFCGAGSILVKDLPPYVMAGGEKVAPHGINSEGLRRRGFNKDTIMAIRRAYKVLYRQGLSQDEAVQQLNDMAKKTPEVALLAEFVAASQRGIIR